MALIVETGLVVANSNTYVSRADYITYAASLGVTIPNTDAADVQLIKAALFIGQHEANLKGFKVLRDQSMAFPRTGVVIDGWAWNYTEIPRNVILCQMQVALDINAGFDPWNPASNPNMIKKRSRVEGAVDVEYAVGDRTGQKLSRTSTADALLASLLNRSGLFSIELVRA
jgi:hypothetical protein